MEDRARRRSKRARRRAVRKLIPAIIAIVLFIIIGCVGLSTGLLKKMSYSTKEADYYEYFGLTSDEDMAVLVGHEYVDEKAIIRAGKVYIPQDMAEEYFCDNFYYDEHDNCLLYTDAEKTSVYNEEAGDYIVKGDKMYLSLDVLSLYSSTKTNVFTQPNHMEICDQEAVINVADIVRDTQVRVLGGIKSDVLTTLEEGEQVQIINPMDDWSEIKSSDGFIGYVENKYLDNFRQENITVVAVSDSPQVKHTLRDHKICLGWHQVMSQEANKTFMDVVKDEMPMNVISPTWYSLSDNEGNITSITSKEYVKRAHEKGLEVWALVDNFSDAVNSYEVLSYTDRRRRLIDNLVLNTLDVGADGINIDFENLPTECGPSFAQFIRELSIPCRKNGLVLSVDNYVPRGYTEYYNRKAQGEYADYVIIMGYDEHYAGSEESGSVASFDFVQDGIIKTLEDVSEEQVINGIPFYTRIWQEGSVLSSEAVTMETAQSFISSHGLSMDWYDSCAQYYGEKQEDGVTYKIWLEDARSIKAKLDLMESSNIAGVACWKLGFETSDIWDVIGDYIAN